MMRVQMSTNHIEIVTHPVHANSQSSGISSQKGRELPLRILVAGFYHTMKVHPVNDNTTRSAASPRSRAKDQVTKFIQQHLCAVFHTSEQCLQEQDVPISLIA